MSIINVDFLPLPEGKCAFCAEAKECPMKEMLTKHRENALHYGELYECSRPDLWDLEAIDEPEFIADYMTWCPMYTK